MTLPPDANYTSAQVLHRVIYLKAFGGMSPPVYHQTKAYFWRVDVISHISMSIIDEVIKYEY